MITAFRGFGRPIWEKHTRTHLEKVVDVHGGEVAARASRMCV